MSERGPCQELRTSIEKHSHLQAEVGREIYLRLLQMPSHILSGPPFGQIQSEAREYESLADAIHKGQPPGGEVERTNGKYPSIGCIKKLVW